MPRSRQAQAKALGINGSFLVIASLFFAWGFTSANNDPLIAALRATFHLSYLSSLATQLVFFAAFGLISLPAAALGTRLGADRALFIALLTMAAGCLLVCGALQYGSYIGVLAALFVLAAGLTTLQVAANPLAANAGSPASSHFRLTFAQALNAIGVVLGSRFGAWAMLGRGQLPGHQGAVPSPAETAAFRNNIGEAFVVMAAMVAALGIGVLIQRRRLASIAEAPASTAPRSTILAAFRSRWAIAGAVTIGLYVGAEVSIGSVMISFLNLPSIMGTSLSQGGRLLATFYWGGAMVGRIAGSLLLTRIPAARLLAGCAITATALCTIASCAGGEAAGFAALAVGLCNAVMFPTIFSLTLERSTAHQEATSGLLCQAIAGGAIVPILVGSIADRYGLPLAFLIPAIAYLAVIVFALRAAWPNKI